MIYEDMKQIEEKMQEDFTIILAKTHDCSVCKVTKAQLQPLLDKYNTDVVEVFIDDVAEFRGKHLVFTVPTVMIFSEGREMLRESRFINMGKVTKMFSMFYE